MADDVQIVAEGLTMGYGRTIVQRDVSFAVRRGGIFIIMGGSGSGKSTLMRHLVGLQPPLAGRVLIDGQSLWEADETGRASLRRKMGVLFQSGALWSSMTVAQNVALPLLTHTRLSAAAVRQQVALKLALVGLAGQGDRLPAELSGGMRRRAGLARAMALDPEILFCDEPSSGLDPVNSRRLDDLIAELRDRLGTTVVLVTHELASIFAIGTDSIFLDDRTRTLLAAGPPQQLRDHPPHPVVAAFLTRADIHEEDLP